MEISYVICDSCGASVPEATGALVLPYGGKPKMHLCEKCFSEVLEKRREEILKKVKCYEAMESASVSLES